MSEDLFSLCPLIKLSQCEICLEVPEGSLKAHLAKEHSQDLFHCTVGRCDECYVHFNQLIKHLTLEHAIYGYAIQKMVKCKKILLPSNLKVFRCQACKVSLFSQHQWVNHHEVCTSTDSRFECRACHLPGSFATENIIDDHIYRQHSSWIMEEERKDSPKFTKSVTDNLLSFGCHTMPSPPDERSSSHYQWFNKVDEGTNYDAKSFILTKGNHHEHRTNHNQDPRYSRSHPIVERESSQIIPQTSDKDAAVIKNNDGDTTETRTESKVNFRIKYKSEIAKKLLMMKKSSDLPKIRKRSYKKVKITNKKKQLTVDRAPCHEEEVSSCEDLLEETLASKLSKVNKKLEFVLNQAKQISRLLDVISSN